MPWLFRTIGLIFLAFVALCVVGFFMGDTQHAETSTELRAEPFEVYELLSDLQTYPDWSGLAGREANWVFGGSKSGVGQTAAWKQDDRFGTLELTRDSQDEFVMLRVEGPLGEQTVTLALNEGSAESGSYRTVLLIKSEKASGGFPYIGRLADRRRIADTQAALERAAAGMDKLFSDLE